MRHFPVVTMLEPEMATKSAENYRKLRQQGITVRKTIDVMIATYCMNHDFDPIVQHLGLQAYLC